MGGMSKESHQLCLEIQKAFLEEVAFEGGLSCQEGRGKSMGEAGRRLGE